MRYLQDKMQAPPGTGHGNDNVHVAHGRTHMWQELRTSKRQLLEGRRDCFLSRASPVCEPSPTDKPDCPCCQEPMIGAPCSFLSIHASVPRETWLVTHHATVDSNIDRVQVDDRLHARYSPTGNISARRPRTYQDCIGQTETCLGMICSCIRFLVTAEKTDITKYIGRFDDATVKTLSCTVADSLRAHNGHCIRMYSCIGDAHMGWGLPTKNREGTAASCI
ncbi:hypothetical protein LX36DRAFT_102474 [Colletotrichum falcatum]|nr:hypothetical protein LX36DRAFT_102474 [Colletotrichum falcatum]